MRKFVVSQFTRNHSFILAVSTKTTKKNKQQLHPTKPSKVARPKLMIATSMAAVCASVLLVCCPLGNGEWWD